MDKYVDVGKTGTDDNVDVKDDGLVGEGDEAKDTFSATTALAPAEDDDNDVGNDDDKVALSLIAARGVNAPGPSPLPSHTAVDVDVDVAIDGNDGVSPLDVPVVAEMAVAACDGSNVVCIAGTLTSVK